MAKTQVDWKHIDWTDVQKYVEKMQNKIYQASKSDNVQQMVKLQHTLARSYRARLLAVRKVTQDNRGKRTAGVDDVASLNPKQRLFLAENLRLDGSAKPLRRVQIPKANGKVRNLGIPTIEDRAKQCLAKFVLEPQWEAKFKGCNYGFRPGKSCHDAIGDIFLQIRQTRNNRIYEADISKCFDEINHQYLLNEIKTFPTLRRQVKAGLKAGVKVQFNQVEATEKGTPQGGVISPLLANIALHRLDEFLAEPSWKKRFKLVRYADDFVLVIKDKREKESGIKKLIQWIIKPIGLKLSEEKSKLTDCLTGVDF